MGVKWTWLVIKTFAIGERQRSAFNIHIKRTLITSVYITTISIQIVGTYTAVIKVLRIRVNDGKCIREGKFMLRVKRVVLNMIR